MKRIVNFSLCLAIIFTMFFTPLVNAAIVYKGKVLTDLGLSVRQGPGTSYTKIGELAYGVEVELVSGTPVSLKGCSSGWYQIHYNGSTDAYVCASYLSITSSSTSGDTAGTDYEKLLESKGFPSSYWGYLSELHEKYPNWEFEAVQTNLDWSLSVEAESEVGVSLIQTDHDGWKSTAPGSYDPQTGEFIVLEGTNWYAASPKVVAYYMDPRNFLNEKNIFMFEKLSFDSSYQTKEAVRKVFNGGSMANYTEEIYQAGVNNNTNPVYLASRIRQEVGSNVGDSRATTGETFTYDNQTYSGLYNVYNIGATTGASPVLRGLVWANGGSDGSATSYNRPWRSIEASIAGGAQMIASSYINKGQDTTYFQRFDVSPNAGGPYEHQYMTNIKEVYSESLTAYSSYEAVNLLNNQFKFAIPVYNNMPSTPAELPGFELELPDEGDTPTVPEINPDDLVHTVGLKTDGEYISGIYEGMKVDDLVTSLKSNGGTISTIAHGNLANGDPITINGKEYKIVLYGDVDNDATIGLKDLVQLKKYILGYNNLNDIKLKAADANQDGKVSLSDLVLMKKKILGLESIKQ